MLRLIDEKSARALIDDRAPSERIGESFVYTTKTGGRVYRDETECLYDDAPTEPIVDKIIETPFD